MKSILHKIANTLILNTHNVNNYGLLDGKMGIAIFFYHFSRFTNNPVYNDFADDLIDEIYIYHEKPNIPLDMSNGVSGIGFGINGLIRDNYLEGELDKVLEDLDMIVNNLTVNHLRLIQFGNISISPFGLYYLSRNKYKDNLHFDFLKILKVYKETFEKQELFSLSLVNSILYFLDAIIKFNTISNEIPFIYKEINNIFSQNKLVEDYDDSDILLLSRILNRADLKLKKNLDSAELFLKDKINDIKSDPIDTFIKNTWINLLYEDCKIENNIPPDIDKTIDEIQLCLVNDNLTLNKGLAGIGLGILQNMKSLS